MSIDKQTLMGMKGKAGRWQLAIDLSALEKEKKAEMRMHNTTKQKFKSQYFRLENTYERGKDPADVRMYETHNPGFCYRRNGECRISSASASIASADYQDIYDLLFTDDELDIEKVLCLHLLTAHRTETIAPPNRKTRSQSSLLPKSALPVERLIERSKKKRSEMELTKLLPTYVLDVTPKKPGDEDTLPETLINDGRLAARVMVNDKIQELVHTVIHALEQTNPEKLQQLVGMASDVEVIKKVIAKPYIQQFLETLDGQALVCSCESFHLTQPFKVCPITLDLSSTQGSLSHLVNYIRQNVFQMPSHSTWKLMYDRSQAESKGLLDYEDEEEETKSSESSSKQKTKEKRNVRTRSPRKDGAKGRRKSSSITSGSGSSSPRTVGAAVRRDSDSGNTAVLEEELSFSHGSNNTTEVFRRMDINALADMITSKAAKAHKRDVQQFLTSDPREYTDESATDLSANKESTVPKVLSKHTNCLACLQKSREHPPRLRRPTKTSLSSQAKDLDLNDLKSASAIRLSKMLDDEVKKLKQENRRLSELRKSGVPLQKYTRKGSGLRKQSSEAVELDKLDLARISQEIKEQETKRKLQKFLENKV